MYMSHTSPFWLTVQHGSSWGRSRQNLLKAKKAQKVHEKLADKEFAQAWQKRLEVLKAEEVGFPRLNPCCSPCAT